MLHCGEVEGQNESIQGIFDGMTGGRRTNWDLAMQGGTIQVAGDIVPLLKKIDGPGRMGG
jgi:hypothetical protein